MEASQASSGFAGSAAEDHIRPEYAQMAKDMDFFIPKVEHRVRAKKAVWFGYSSNFKYLNKALDVITQHNLELTVISNEDFIVPQIYYGRLNVVNVRYNFATVNEEIKKADMAILPQPDDYKGSFKTDNKTTDCWALGVPVATTPEDVERFMDEKERTKEKNEKLYRVIIIHGYRSLFFRL